MSPGHSNFGASVIGLALIGVVVLAVALPSIWLKWETEAAQAQAATLAETASATAQTTLEDLFARFERATGLLRGQDLLGDPVALTARLLRAPALIAPASGLLVLNGRGQQVASSTVTVATANETAWWFRPMTSAVTRASVLGCGAKAPDGPGWMLARGIEGPQNIAVGWVGSFIPEAALRSLAVPANPKGAVSYVLSDVDGCELLSGSVGEPVASDAAMLIRWYRALLPTTWTVPQPAVSTVKVGNLVLTDIVVPEAALALRSAEMRLHSRTVFALAGALCCFVILAGTVVAFGWPRCREAKAQAPVYAPTVPAEDGDEPMRRKLEEMKGERDRVLAAIGHDVRTPMNSILGICALLLDGNLDEAQRKWLQRIRASCQALLAMLNGMLEIAAARVDGAEINREPVDVADLVEEAGEVMRPQAEDKGLELRVAIEESVLGIWSTDPTRLRQVLFNLCGNAVKYTVHGSVEIRATAERNGDRYQLRLRVTDTGPGIAENEREVIFEQFKRGRDEVSRGHEGLGLGLALCREIATLLGGDLSVDSTLGAGSVFTFEIPVERADAPAAKGGPLAGRSALVVGLSEGVRRRVASHLESIGFMVETVGDGFMAIGLAERMAYQHGTLDVMVLDAALVGLSAEALMARLQASHSLESLKTVLVANGPLAAAAEGRADALVPHPVEARALDHVLADLFGDRSILQEVDPCAPAAPKARILVVEDNRINQALFVDQLTRAGFSTFAASNGKEAIEAVQRGGFDGILMDVQMPEIDGIEATRRIRADQGERQRIPIIGMTAHTGTIVRKRCLDAGMDVVLHKPVDFAALPLRLREVIAGAQAVRRDDLVSDAMLAPNASLDVDDEFVQVILAEVGFERAENCVKAFLADTPVHLAEMTRLLGDAQWEELRRLAHSLAGIAGTLGAISLADGLLMLEDAAQTGDLHPASATLREVQVTWERTHVTLWHRFCALSADRNTSAKKAA
jgi:signal transduction histidine kinase/CheY-like chemotaxis protein